MGHWLSNRSGWLLFSLLIVVLHPEPVDACYPEIAAILPESNATFTVPITGSFRYELERAFGVEPPEARERPQAGMGWNGRITIEADALKSALERADHSPQERVDISNRYTEFRRYWLATVPAETGVWSAYWSPWVEPDPPRISAPAFPTELPAEFALYAEGSEAFWRGDNLNATCAFDELLALPADSRQEFSVAAAYTLSQLELPHDQQRAEALLLETIQLHDAGFADPLDLVTAAGEGYARFEETRHNVPEAMARWGDCLRHGDYGAVPPLGKLARRLLSEEDDALAHWATDRVAAPVITAYVLAAFHGSAYFGDFGSLPDGELQVRWLRALEGTQTPCVEADRIAWLAYRAGDYDSATRWLARSPSLSPHGLWIKAKLAVRQGDRPAARRLLEAAVAGNPEAEWMPRVHEGGDDPRWNIELYTGLGSLDYGLAVDAYYPPIVSTPLCRIFGDLGALQVADGDFTVGLETLMRGAYWDDAADIAECVLTVPELIRYVRAHDPDSTEVAPDFQHPRGMLRYLLARRLARLERWDEAQKYMPREYLSGIEEFLRLRTRGRDLRQPAKSRVRDLYAAAWLLRHNGLEWMGTERAPDDHADNGGFPFEVSSGFEPDPSYWIASTSTARREATDREVVPYKRFHYRYKATDLVLEAANLLPDDDPNLALMLCIAGHWTKGRDPEYADKLYKVLAIRCPDTELGKEANAEHWFPACPEVATLP